LRTIVIEHPGTERYNDLAQKLQTILGFEYECETEQMIGDSGEDLQLHWQQPVTNDLIYIASMKAMPSKKALEYYIKFGTEDEE